MKRSPRTLLQAPLPWVAPFLFLFLCVSIPFGWAASPDDIYRTGDLPALQRQAQQAYHAQKAEFTRRQTETSKVRAEIKQLQSQIGDSNRKRDQLQPKISQLQRQEQILNEKAAVFQKRMNEQAALYQKFTKLQKSRAAELAKVPPGSSSSWTLPQSKAAKEIYGLLLQRAKVQQDYYRKRYSGSATSVAESARQQNLLQDIASEIKNYTRSYQVASGAVSQRSLLQERRAEESRQEAAQAEELAAKEAKQAEEARLRAETAAQATATPRPTATPAPTPEPTPTPEPDTTLVFMLRLNKFISEFWYIWMLIMALAIGGGLYGALELDDPDNPKHKIASAALFGVAGSILMLIPVFGPVLVFLSIVISFPAYYQMPLEKCMRPTLVVFASLILAALLVALLSILLA